MRKALTVLFLVPFAFLAFDPRIFKSFRLLSLKWAENQVLPITFERNIAFYPLDLVIIVGAAFVLSRRILRQNKALLFFFGAFFFSLLVSSGNMYPLHYVRFVHFFVGGLFFFALLEVKSEEFLKRSALILLFVACFESGLVFLQYFSQQEVGLKALGEIPLTRSNDISTIFVTTSQKWIFDEALPFGKQFIRPSGTFPHANILGGFLILGQLATSALWVHLGGHLKKARVFFNPGISHTDLCFGANIF